MPYAAKGRRGHERKVENDAAKCCKVSDVYAKENLVKAIFSKIKLRLQQMNYLPAKRKKFIT